MLLTGYQDLQFWTILLAVRYGAINIRLRHPPISRSFCLQGGYLHALCSCGECKGFAALSATPPKCLHMDVQWCFRCRSLKAETENNFCKSPLKVCISRNLLPNYLSASIMIDSSALWTAYVALLCLDNRLQGLSILMLLCTEYQSSCSRAQY